MSRIEQLIEELCQGGVEFKELSKVAEIGTGSSNGNEATDSGKYPLYVRSKIVKRIDTFEFDEEAIIIPGEGGIGEIFHYINGKYALHQRAYRIKVISSEISTKFLCYYMMSNFKEFILQKAVNATVISIRKPMIEKFSIPIPPLPIQQEIVNILDTFTALDASLQAELEARRKQYEHYRNQLLNFEGKEVEWKMLGEIGNIQRGVRVVRNQLLESGKYPVYQNSMKPLGYFDKKNFKANTTFIISAGAAGDIGYSDVDFWAADDCFLCLCPDNLKSKFLYYFLLCNQNYLYSRVRRASVPRLSRDVVEKIKIPLPPLSEQERIVGILDKFDALVNTELPAEIAARRKQYEYYREKLLTFEPLAN